MSGSLTQGRRGRNTDLTRQLKEQAEAKVAEHWTPMLDGQVKKALDGSTPAFLALARVAGVVDGYQPREQNNFFTMVLQQAQEFRALMRGETVEGEVVSLSSQISAASPSLPEG